MRHVATGLIFRGLLILLLSFTTAWAQATAQLNGTVKDQSGDGYRWLDPAAFRAPAAGTFGSLENNSLVGPSRFNVDMGLTRSLRIGGAQQFQFRAEAFNVLNRVHVSNPVSALNNPNFGLITSAADPRIIQLAVKYTF